MMGLSLGHLLILLAVVLIFGAKRLPGLGTALGRGVRSFKEGLEDSKPDPKLDKDRDQT